MTGASDFERWARGEADPVLGVDPFALGFGGWPSMAPGDDGLALCLAVLEAEADHRAAEFAALETVLAAIGPDGKTVIPDDLAEW